MSEKLFHLNKLELTPSLMKEKDTVSLHDIFNTPGEIYSVTLTTFVFDLQWLFDELPILTRIPVQFVHNGTLNYFDQLLIQEYKDFETFSVPLKKGCHHVKIMIILYEGGLRFVLSTANLIPLDYNLKSQGIYIKDFKPSESSTVLNEKGAHFLTTLQSYFTSVNVTISYLSDFDYSTIDGWLLLSIPGTHKGNDLNKYGMKQVYDILNNKLHVQFTNHCTIAAQASSLGLFTNQYRRELSLCLTNQPESKFQIIWPTEDFIRTSETGYHGSCSFFLRSNFVKTWENYFYKFLPPFPRHLIQPHIKTYVIYEEDIPKYGILTSSNISGAAWGKPTNSTLEINNYEMGMLFIDNFTLTRFPLPYDIKQSTKYSSTDIPWINDIDHEVIDIDGYVIKDNNFIKLV
ncbi:hypothetical protein ENUP19_0248G0109 [Entamoeba nuttalli]|uniref:Tyrosyl-DNA phosphodiesterase, putative n=2 Tax=Entamoeba nuttalli TaxID=412467 RepID=K2H536_ENTNP|nr:tyrosyl-DNA phosphodiesterase, putative [Entamoeba nuttalli P19]EKE37579.1 tyrosyl-DNA phosphodiesterase, putative [Entamoeba nuttalli P19]|eukprot:XP_008860105.1 tyrosyl-DNA phosphodiesterase, putative [Entamoeba nuttalli P19]